MLTIKRYGQKLSAIALSLFFIASCGKETEEAPDTSSATSETNSTFQTTTVDSSTAAVVSPRETSLELPWQDSFSAEVLDASYVVHNSSATAGISVAEGQLVVPVVEESAWWQSQNSAFYVYQKTKSHAIMLTTSVRARSTADTSVEIDSGYHYAGPMIRASSSDPSGLQNFAFIGVGYQEGCGAGNTPCIETKSTQDNDAAIGRYPVDATQALLRLCLLNGEMRAFVRDIGGMDGWVLRETWMRPDLTGDLQVGLMAFSFDVNDDLFTALFDDISVEEISSFDECS